MKYINPTLLSVSPGGDFPITMPQSGGMFIANPTEEGSIYFVYYFDDGRIARYNSDFVFIGEGEG